MAERLNGKDVDSVSEVGVVVLRIEQRSGHAHRVDADQSGLGGIHGIVGQAVADLEITKMRDSDRDC